MKKKPGKPIAPTAPGQLMLIGDVDSFVIRKAARAKRGSVVGARPTPIEARLMDAAFGEDPCANLMFQHTVFCQTSLPYRNPGDEVRKWERVNGNVHLQVLAGAALDPRVKRMVDVGLPFGPKSRLLLMHISAEALRQGSHIVDIEKSLTGFVERLGLASNGRNILTTHDQLTRLMSSSIRMGFMEGSHAITVNSQIVDKFDLWLPGPGHESLWTSKIRLSLAYWQSLQEHAVPLDEAHMKALSHSAMALDIYLWLAHRLRRVPEGKPVTISWPALHLQFGQGYGLLYNFRRVFLETLKQVLTVYKSARVDLNEERDPPVRCEINGEMVWREEVAKGLTLHNSPPPVAPKVTVPST